MKMLLKLNFKKIGLPSCWGLRSPQTAIMIASDLKNSGYATEKHDLLNESDMGISESTSYEVCSLWYCLTRRGTCWLGWLRHCATSRKVAGSTPHGVIGFLRPHYCPGVYSACNKKDNHVYLVGGNDGLCVGLTTLPTSCTDYLQILGAWTSLSPNGLSEPVQR